jgi:hypothetical protein
MSHGHALLANKSDEEVKVLLQNSRLTINGWGDIIKKIAQNGIYATRDEEMIKEDPEIAATSVLTYINKFDETARGFRGHYDRLSERCHPNSAGHNFIFSELDRSDGTVRFCEEREPKRNAKMILAALAPLPLAETISERLDNLIEKVSELHHRVVPVGGGKHNTNPT